MSFVKMHVFLLQKGCSILLLATLGGKRILVALPLRINHGFLKPCFQATGTLV